MPLHALVPIQDDLYRKRRMPTHFDRAVPPIAIQDVKPIVIYLGAGLLACEVAALAYIPDRCLTATH